MGIQNKKRFLKQANLAFVNQSHLYIALFNKKLLRINFKMDNITKILRPKEAITQIDLPSIDSLPFIISSSFKTDQVFIVLRDSVNIFGMQKLDLQQKLVSPIPQNLNPNFLGHVAGQGLQPTKIHFIHK